MPVRRARGYVPAPVAVDFSGCVFAAGAHLKNTVCLAAGGSAFLSQYHGDLEEEGNWRFFREGCSRLLELVRERPRVVACDLHPDYLSTRYAEELAERHGCPLVRVQHHEAHVASVLAEHRFRGKALGAAFDGTGLGSDGAIWGGEFFVTEDGASFRRFAHLALFPLPGGDKAARSRGRRGGARGAVGRRLPEPRPARPDRADARGKRVSRDEEQARSVQRRRRAAGPGVDSGGPRGGRLMCLAVPARVVSLGPGGSAEVEFGSLRLAVRTDLMPDLERGDYVLVHAGFVIARLDEEEAAERYEMLSELEGEGDGDGE